MSRAFLRCVSRETMSLLGLHSPDFSPFSMNQSMASSFTRQAVCNTSTSLLITTSFFICLQSWPLKPRFMAPPGDDGGWKNNQRELKPSCKMNANDMTMCYLWKSEILMCLGCLLKIRMPRANSKDEQSSFSYIEKSTLTRVRCQFHF